MCQAIGRVRAAGSNLGHDRVALRHGVMPCLGALKRCFQQLQWMAIVQISRSMNSKWFGGGPSVGGDARHQRCHREVPVKLFFIWTLSPFSGVGGGITFQIVDGNERDRVEAVAWSGLVGWGAEHFCGWPLLGQFSDSDVAHRWQLLAGDCQWMFWRWWSSH